MQPPPVIESDKVTYQISRDFLIQNSFRRLMLQPRMLISMGVLIVVSIMGFLLRDEMEWLSVFCISYVIIKPIITYRTIAKTIDGNSQFTEPKTLDFGPAHFYVIGSGWRMEMTWRQFKRFSEDRDNFYLAQSDTGLASVLPKSAFTPVQQQKFRQYAQTRTT